MRRNKFQVVPIALLTFLLAVVLSTSGCQEVDTPHTAGSGSGPASSSSNGKIAVTTKSEEARKEFLAGRDLAEKLRITDSVQHFDKAIALDPDFALAGCHSHRLQLPGSTFVHHLSLWLKARQPVSNVQKTLWRLAMNWQNRHSGRRELPMS